MSMTENQKDRREMSLIEKLSAPEAVASTLECLSSASAHRYSLC